MLLYRSKKDGENIEITVENKHIKGPEIYFRAFNNNNIQPQFVRFDFCRGPQLILMSFT